MSSLPKIQVIGSLNVDYVTYTSRMPSAGETLTSNGFEIGFGGKGANQAVACARLSRKRASRQDGSVVVQMAGAVGNDAYGRQMLEDLSANGIDTAEVHMDGKGCTGAAVIVVEEDTGENRILVSPNANYTLCPERFGSFAQPPPKLIVMQLEIPLDTVLHVLKSAHAAKIQTLLNPAPAQKLPEEAYAWITHLVMNESECALLSGISESDVDNEEKIASTAGTFLSKGVTNVVITRGGKGVCYFASNGHRGTENGRKVSVVDTTAAGDTFIGAYAAAIATGDGSNNSLDAAVKQANKAAAVAVTRKGAQASIPWTDDLEKFEKL